MGRPTLYSPEMVDKICTQICSGKSLNEITRNPKMPAFATISFWLLDPLKKDFLEKYEIAQQIRAQYLFEHVIEVSKNPLKGTSETVNSEGETTIRTEDAVNRSTLYVKSLMWALARMAPKKYGNKLDVTSDDKPLEGTKVILGMEITQEVIKEDTIQD